MENSCPLPVTSDSPCGCWAQQVPDIHFPTDPRTEFVAEGENIVTNWYVKQPAPEFDEQPLGPLHPSELLRLVRDGAVGPAHLLRKDDSDWFEAREIGGLFEAAMRPTIRYFCPDCDTPIPEVPHACPKCGLQVVQAREEITENTIIELDDNAIASQTGHSVQKWRDRKARKKGKDQDA